MKVKWLLRFLVVLFLSGFCLVIILIYKNDPTSVDSKEQPVLEVYALSEELSHENIPIRKIQITNPPPNSNNTLTLHELFMSKSLWQYEPKPVNGQYQLNVNSNILNDLKPGKTLYLTTPFKRKFISTALKGTKTESVLKGDIIGGEEYEKVIVSIGTQKIEIVMMTKYGSYHASIDKQTGRAVLFNESEIINTNKQHDY